MVKPTGKEPAYDGMFFAQGQPFNQGNIYSVTEEAIIDAFERAEKACVNINKNGVKLGKTLTYSNTVDKLLEQIF